MGYRGEDVSATDGDWRRQTPWQPASGTAPGNAGAWDDGSRGYRGDENYPAADGGGYGYAPDGGYPGQGQQGQQGQQGYGPQNDQHGNPYGQQPYEQQPYEQYGGYGPDPGQGGASGYGAYGPPQGQGGMGGYEPQQGQGGAGSGYGPGSTGSYGPQQGGQGGAGGYGGYGGPQGQGGAGGYGPEASQGGAGGYGGYRPQQGQGGAGGYSGPPGYAQDDYGYERGPNPAPGYEQPAGYDQPSGYGQGGYDQRSAPGYGAGGGYQDLNGGYGQPAGYPALPAGGGYSPAPTSGGNPALPSGSGSYPVEDAGNDWYGGQPAAAKGASFADTGSYALNGRAIDEYGTGPRGALRDPVRGYPPGPGSQGSGPLPLSANPALSGPQAFQRSGPQPVAETRQQARYDETTVFPDYGKDDPGTQPGRAANGGFQGAASDGVQGTGGHDAFDGHGEYDDYQDGFNELGTDDDPYQDRYGDGTGPRPADGGRGPNQARGGRSPRGPLRGKRLLFAALGVVAVGIIGVAAYVFLLQPGSPASNPSVQGPLPSAGAQPSAQACVKQLGTYCHISAATDDPTPLTTAELFPPAFTNETDKTSYALVSTKVDKTCSGAVIGQALITAMKSGKCTQVLRASYVSGGNKIMGTIGVVNLSTTNEAHYAGKVVGHNDFIAPLTSAKGVASKLGNGTGIVEAQYKGHYLILTWSEFVNGADPTTAQDTQLEQFSNDLVAGTANVDLSQRMVTGAAATPGSTS
jgi:hypothetical protein